MEDGEIINLYWKRSERAIAETAKKYAHYCRMIAFNILHDDSDAEECVNDMYLRAWQSIPPKRPEYLPAFLGKITRNLALNRFQKYTAKKRGGGETKHVLFELEECIPTPECIEDFAEEASLSDAIGCFLKRLPKEKRIVFVQRYWYLMPVTEIAHINGISESKAKLMLFRMRKKLRLQLEREGIFL